MQRSKMHVVWWALLMGVLFVCCRQPPQQAPLRSLRSSGQVTFVCIGPDGQGRPLTDCPQGPRLPEGGLSVANPGFHLHALVTQTVTAEVAVVRITGGRGVSGVIDVDSSNPGITPLRVGGKPRHIVTTPGGSASFVGVAETGREGIFALATQCLGPPAAIDEDGFETVRDITTWPACSLPTAPGDMKIVFDPPDDAGQVRQTCDAEYVSELSMPPSVGHECGADLRSDTQLGGRPKLAVALPDWGQIAILDAQEILNREPGTFAPCPVETVLTLENALPEVVKQPLPEDLVLEQCTDDALEYGPYSAFTARPAGMAERDGRLFVADRGGPLVHVLDVRNACAPVELAPLVATSLLEPRRIVTTAKVAVSPVTTRGEQFVYAIDEQGERSASVMIFDVTPGRAQRTPLVREHSSLIPTEPPDRIAFAAAAKDVAFARHDLPLPDVVTGEVRGGVQCDPNPDIDPDSPEARYRTTTDFGRGARPSTLRGTFGFVLLSNGQVAVIDVEDLDADCRRPVTTNTQSVFDFRGCANDVREEPFLDNGVRTVSGEVSCRSVVPHRPRSSRFLTTTTRQGIGAPSLRAVPRLSRHGRGLPISNLLPQGRVNPLMTAVDFESPVPGGEPIPAEAFIGVTLRERGIGREALVLEPSLAEQASLVLPWIEPRAYPIEETVTVTFEGPLAGERAAGHLAVQANQGIIEDRDALFCGMGVQDLDLTREVGLSKFGLEPADVDEFAERHGDYVQITSRLLPPDDSYWRSAGAQCGEGGGYDLCQAVFGVGDTDELPVARDLSILEAYQDHLVLEPRTDEVDMDFVRCCFPEALSYRVRAGQQWVVRGSVSGFRHDVTSALTTDGQSRCVRDCSPWRPERQGRVFEVSSIMEGCPPPGAVDAGDPLPPGCAVGPATEDDLVCVYDAATGPISPGGPASECIHDSLTARFIVYRGLEPSQRNMNYAFDVVGGFSRLAMSLTTGTSTILPVAITEVPGFDQLAVVDSHDRGLMMLTLRGVGVFTSFF